MRCGLEKADFYTTIHRELHVIAENKRLEVAFQYEDTYMQIVVMPKYYTKDMRETIAERHGFYSTGNDYENDRGQWIVEALVPYKISKEARRILRRFLKAYGIPSKAKQLYRNLSFRKCPWTSYPAGLNAFKEDRAAQGVVQ
jgi:hypothetical protein